MDEKQKSVTGDGDYRISGDKVVIFNDRYAGYDTVVRHIKLPPDEHLTVKLVPGYQLERLEEKRSDEGIALLLIGLFGGAVLGILSNWATDETFTITRMSIVLMGLFASLCFLCFVWVLYLRQKSNALRDSIFGENSRTNPPDTQER